MRLLFAATVAAFLIVHSSSAWCQTAPPVEPAPTDGVAGSSTAAPPVATEPATTPAAAATAGAAATVGPAAPPPAADQGELEMEFSTNKRDIESFTTRSLQEMRLGAGRARYSLNFFGDVYAGANYESGSKVSTSFGTGGLSFILTGEVGDTTTGSNATSALRITAEPAIEFNDKNEPGVDLERLQLRYSYKGFWIDAGRSHVDVGHWNVAFHHGKLLQPTILRPRILRFEDNGGLLPLHWVGIQAGYRFDLGNRKSIALIASVGNSRGAIVDDVQSGFDSHRDKQGHAKLEFAGFGHRDLKLGVSGIYGTIAPQPDTVRANLPDTALTEYIGNAYVAFPSDPWLAFAEAYVIEHRAPGAHWDTYAGFVVLGYSLGAVTPYVRAERVVMTGGIDPFFVPTPASPTGALDVYEGAAGARFDLSHWCAVKAEYTLVHTTGVSHPVHGLTASWQFGI